MDARERGIRQGQWVRAWNDRGEAFFVADVNGQRCGGGGLSPESLVAALQPARLELQRPHQRRPADMGSGATFHTNLVQVEASLHIPST